MEVVKEDIQFWLAVNDEGSRVVSFESAADAIGTLVNEFGGAAVRTVEMTVLMALPTAVEVETIEVSDEDVDQDIKTAIKEIETAAA
jgi:hypothetical protein